MMQIDTITRALLKSAVMGKDPFSADYTQGGSAMTVLPGSMESKRQEAMQEQTVEQEAEAKQQQSELKQQQKAVTDAQKHSEKLNQDHQKTQQELMSAKAQVEAYKARDTAATQTGLSPSFNVTQKRMQDRVKSLGKATNMYNDALTLNKAAGAIVKLAWWEQHFSQPAFAQVAELVKIADSMNPPSVAIQPKKVTGSPIAKEPRVSEVEAKKTPVAAPTGSSQAVRAPEDFGSLGGSQDITKGTNTHQWAKQFGGPKGMNDAQKAQYKNMLQQETQAAQAEGNRGWWGNTTQAVKDVFSTDEGRAEIADNYRRFAGNPNDYMKDIDSVTGDRYFRNALNRNTEEGSIGRSLGTAAATGGDWVKNVFTHGGNTVAGGAVGGVMGAHDMLTGAKDVVTGGLGQLGKDGWNTKWTDLAKATQAGRDKFNGGSALSQTGNKNRLFGGLQLGSNFALPGAGGIGGGLARNTAMGAAGYGGEGIADAMNAGETAGPTASPMPPNTSGTYPQMSEQQMRDIFQGSYGNPGFAQNINDYSGWANPNMFPQAMAGYNAGNPNSFMGQLGNFAMGMFGQPDFNSFQQGQSAFRNAGSPQFNSMNNAMSAFGRNMGYPNQMMQQNQFRPPALSGYGY